MSTDLRLPGRLGNPDATIETDGRCDPRLVSVAMQGYAPGVAVPPADASYEDCLAYCAELEGAADETHPLQLAAMPNFDHVDQSTETIQGADDNDITLYIHRPKGVDGPLPGLVHLHGGGMVILTAADPDSQRWRNTLAAEGLVVVGVEFRNGGGKLGPHPFPAGLNDCAAGARWTHANRDTLGIATITVSGESGGGNLSLATGLKARQEGWVDEIDGIYALCPYISGAYANPPSHLLSLVENDTYMLECQQMDRLVTAYDPERAHGANPLAWPLAATASDLEGLPPHVISVNELDPLRDEGLAFYRKLLAAGVSAVARTVHGTTHGADLGMPDVIPEVHWETVRSIVGFARSL